MAAAAEELLKGRPSRAGRRRAYRRALLTLAIAVTADQAVETHLFGDFGAIGTPSVLH